MRKIALFGLSSNPPGIHHVAIVHTLLKEGFEVKVIPCGPRPDKPTTDDIEPVHRAAMTDLTFYSISPRITIDLFDLESNKFTPTCELENRYQHEGEIWHVVGTDRIRGGKYGTAPIQSWIRGKELWERQNFIVAIRDGVEFDPEDLPPHHIVIHTGVPGASETIREKAFRHESIKGLVVRKVEEYIERHNLYRGHAAAKQTEIALTRPNIMLVPDPNNAEALACAKKLALLEDEDPSKNLIVTLGGDGRMLRTIRDHWRRRVPFFGINMGHLGFLLNEVRDEVTPEFFTRTFVVWQSPLLYVESTGGIGPTQNQYAFNDAWVQAELGKAGWFEVRVDGEVRIPRLIGDGILLATAAGSTASARAMGANPIPIGTELLILVGSNVAQPLHWRNGANLPIDSVVEFRNADKTGWRKMYGFADGIPLGEIESMRIRVSRIGAPELAFVDDHDIRRKVALTQFPS